MECTALCFHFFVEVKIGNIGTPVVLDAGCRLPVSNIIPIYGTILKNGLRIEKLVHFWSSFLPC